MAAHRYWRIYITATRTTIAAFTEIELASSIEGTDLTGSGTASASSENSGSFVASNAVDNSTGTAWASDASGFPYWWKYDFGLGNAYDIQQVRITPRTGGAETQAPTSFSIQYSDDDSSWTTAVTFTNIYVADQKHGFNFSANTLAHRYWRFSIWETPDASKFIVINEVELRSAISGSDLTGSGTASASQSEGSSPPSNAFDNNTGTYWTPYSGGAPQWLAYDFGSGVAYKIIEFQITPHSTVYATQTPTDFTLLYSDDGAYWVVVERFSGIAWSSNAAQTFSLTQIQVDTSDTLSLSDAAGVTLGDGTTPLTITISENFSLTEGTVKAQRKNAPNIPIIAVDTFGDSFEIVGDFGLQLDTMQGTQFTWDISDVFNLTDAIYSSEYIEIAAETDFTLIDEIAIEVAAGIEVYDSMQDVWDPEDEEELQVALAVPMEISVDDALSFSDEIAFFRVNAQELEDRFGLADSIKVQGASGLSITGDLLALSDALEVGWNPSIESGDALNLDDSGGVEILMPSWFTLEITGDVLALFDGDFSTQGTEVFLGGTRLSYLRRYLNDVLR